MVDTVPTQEYTDTFIVNEFKGLNLKDNEDYLPLGETSRAQNFDINTTRSLSIKKGTTSLYSQFAFPSVAWRNVDFYYDRKEVPYYIGVSYPHIKLITPPSGYSRSIYSGLGGMGEGQFIKGGIGEAMWVDGTNAPVLINGDGVATAVTWPPVYTNPNKGILNESSNARADNPVALGTDIWYPSLGVYFEGRWYLAGDPLAPTRLYASRIRSSNFADNTDSARIDVAFFVDIMSNSPIVAMKVINNKYLVIFCRNEIHLLQGKFPPTAISPQPTISIDVFNSDVGCIGRYAFAEKGDNDIFFISNRQSLYTLTATENFQDVRPYGLSEKVAPLFKEISIERMKRARLINNNIDGELQIWFPDDEKQYYPNKRFVFNYSQGEEAQWGEDVGFGLSLRGAFRDKSTNKLMLVDREKILEDGVGLTYDEEPIALKYQIAPWDGGDRNRIKQILKVTIAYRLTAETAASLIFEHAWDNQKQSGLVERKIQPTVVAKYDDPGTRYGSATYSSNAGKPINEIDFELVNPEGKVFKAFLRCSSPGLLTIVDVKCTFRRLGRSSI